MKKGEDNYDVIVIGGGPSGMMAAGIAGEKGQRVLLLEKNERLGDKLKATGGGRCNITNAEADKEALLRHYGKAKDFLQSPFAQFGVADTFKFFESCGLPLVVEARQRAFPATQKAEDVFRVLEKFMRAGKVTVKTGAKVVKLIKDNDQKVVGVILAPTKGSSGRIPNWARRATVLLGFVRLVIRSKNLRLILYRSRLKRSGSRISRVCRFRL
jgi:predicted Rossmann fold flavoprotein